MIRWLSYWLVGWLVGWSVGQLISSLVDWLADWLASRLSSWMASFLPQIALLAWYFEVVYDFSEGLSKSVILKFSRRPPNLSRILLP